MIFSLKKKNLVFPECYTGQEPFTHCSAAQVSSAMNCLIIHFTHFSIGPFVAGFLFVCLFVCFCLLVSSELRPKEILRISAKHLKTLLIKNKLFLKIFPVRKFLEEANRFFLGDTKIQKNQVSKIFSVAFVNS